MVEDSKRGRVMSIFTMAFTGTMPVGNLLVGAAAERLWSFCHVNGHRIVLRHRRDLVLDRQLPRLRKAAAPVLAGLESEGELTADPAGSGPENGISGS